MFSLECQFGDLVLKFTTSFNFRWNDAGSGANKDGGFWHPIPPDPGYFPLGSIGLGNHADPNGKVAALCVKEFEGAPQAGKGPALSKPVDYTLIWTDRGSGATNDGSCWEPVPPQGYVALGSVFNAGYSKPSFDDVRCVREDLTVSALVGQAIWLDSGSGANEDFGSWATKCKTDTTDDDKTLIDSNTFIGVKSHQAPQPWPKFRSLNLPVPVSTGCTPPPPQLTRKSRPATQTDPVVDRTVIVPFVAITDPGMTTEWQVANSPFYSIERLVSYRLILFNNNDTSVEQTQEQQVETGVERTQSETFSVNTGISVTAKSGVNFLGNEGSVSATVSVELGFSSGSSVAEFRHETSTRRLTTPPKTAAALWAISYQLRLVRMDGTIVAPPLVFEADDFYQSQFPPAPFTKE